MTQRTPWFPLHPIFCRHMLIMVTLDYQAQNNLWLGVEVNTSIICTCVPPLRAPIAKLFPRLFGGSSYHQPSDYNRSRTGAIPIDDSRSRSYKRTRASMMTPNPITSKSGYTTTTIVGATSGVSEADSDEVIMLNDMKPGGAIVQKTDIEVRYMEHW